VERTPPKFPVTHYVDSRIYTDDESSHEELEKLFRPSWIIACHESEMPNAFDYRLFTHPTRRAAHRRARRGHEGARFYNICPHRGNTILYDPRATRSA
jgi:methanesulfonate monooxygenase large subunit